MNEIYKFIENPDNSKKLYIIFVIIGIGMIGNVVKRVIEELKRK